MIESLTLTPIPDEAEIFREGVRSFLDEALLGVAPEIRARSWMGFDAEFSRKLAGCELVRYDPWHRARSRGADFESFARSIQDAQYRVA